MVTWLRSISYIILALFIISIIGLLSVSYDIVICLLGGFMVAQLLIIIVPRILDLETWSSTFILGLLVFLVYFVFALLKGGLGVPLAGGCNLGQTNVNTILTEYHAIIEPVDFSHGVFKVSEEAMYSIERKECNSNHAFITSSTQEGVLLPLAERQVYSTSRGLLIRELRIIPLDGSAISDANTSNLSASTVELRDFPRDSFYEVRDTKKVELSRYLETETVKLEDLSLGRRDIAFAYVAAPFYFYRGLIDPLIGVSYQSQWMFALIGLITTFVITPFVKPVFVDFVKDKLKSLFERNPPQKEEDKTKIIVSSRGDEKEIEVKRKPK